MYKFVRYEQKLGNTTYKSDWMFVPQNLNDVEDFHKQYVLDICNKEFEDCVKSVVKYCKFIVIYYGFNKDIKILSRRMEVLFNYIWR